MALFGIFKTFSLYGMFPQSWPAATADFDLENLFLVSFFQNFQLIPRTAKINVNFCDFLKVQFERKYFLNLDLRPSAPCFWFSLSRVISQNSWWNFGQLYVVFLFYIKQFRFYFFTQTTTTQKWSKLKHLIDKPGGGF